MPGSDMLLKQNGNQFGTEVEGTIVYVSLLIVSEKEYYVSTGCYIIYMSKKKLHVGSDIESILHRSNIIQTKEVIFGNIYAYA